MGQVDEALGACQAVPREWVHAGKRMALGMLGDLWSHVLRG